MTVPSLAREIVAKRVTILALIPTLYALAVGLGWNPPWSSEQAVSLVGGGLTVLAAVVAIFWTRKDVTPADPQLQPTTKNGTPLIPADVAARAHP